MSPSLDLRTPKPVRADRLSVDQTSGRACVWCVRRLDLLTRAHVGYTGSPATRLYACPACALAYRLPVWPEYGAG